MPDVTIVRYRTHPEAAEENHRLVEQVVAELQDQRSAGISYASFRLDDGVTFVHVLIRTTKRTLHSLTRSLTPNSSNLISYLCISAFP